MSPATHPPEGERIGICEDSNDLERGLKHAEADQTADSNLESRALQGVTSQQMASSLPLSESEVDA